MRVALELTGTTPLLMHNIRLADPDDEIVKSIAQITGKRKKTEDDRAEISRLEWYGGLYVTNGQVVMPTANVRRCLVESAKVNRLGKAVTRAVIATALEVPLDYEGPRNIDDLWATGNYINKAAVKVTGRVQRTRPQFMPWAVNVEFEVLTNLLDLDDFERLTAQAGIAEGMGDNRVNGYGRFTAVVKPL